jgi:hypothetical protein
VNKNNVLKTAGNVAAVLSLVFVCKKFVDLNIDSLSAGTNWRYV